MLQWNELRITPDGKFLIIDVEVQNLDYFKDVYLESLQMNVYSKAEDFTSPMPDSKSIILWEEEESVISYEPYTQEDRNNAKIGDIFWNQDIDGSWQEEIINSTNLISIQNGSISAYKQIIAELHSKRVRKYIDIDSISDNLIFVYAIARGEPTEDTPCGVKEKLLVGLVYNKALLYNSSIKTINIINGCTPDKELIDQILKIKMFDLSIAIGDYKTTIKCWNNMFKKQITTKVNCGCYGYQ